MLWYHLPVQHIAEIALEEFSRLSTEKLMRLPNRHKSVSLEPHRLLPHSVSGGRNCCQILMPPLSPQLPIPASFPPYFVRLLKKNK